MNWLDRAIGYVSPVRGARRAVARVAMQSLGYQGAQGGRRTEGWFTSSSSADAESQGINGTRLRDRARSLVRDNPYAASCLDVKVTETIGTGITPEVSRAGIKQLWEAFVENCDADGDLDLYGIQALIERCRSESGECLVRFFSAPRSESQIRSGIVPLVLRVLEPDYLDASRDGFRSSRDGNYVRHGIEYDSSGDVAGYWLYNEHPGDTSITTRIRPSGLASNFVPARDVIHVFRRLRAGQTRGVTDFSPVIMRLRELDDYDDAEVMRKKVEACLAAFITSPAGADAKSLGPVSTDEHGQVTRLFPAMITKLAPGEGVTTAEPKASGGYEEFQRFGLRAISSGYGVPYELMTGDLSQTNYSSYRAGLIRFRRRLEQDQWHIHIPTAMRIWSRFIEEASVIRQLPNLGARTEVEWTPPRFELIDPLKETMAEIEAVLAGFDTWDEVVRRRGWPADEQLQQIAKWQKRVRELGVVLKSDASNASPPPSPPDDEEEEEAA